MDTVRQKLFDLAEEKYQKFSASLIPNCNNLIGVRIGNIRKLSKEIVKSGYALEYLKEGKEDYFEEVMLKGLIIGNLKEDIEVVLEQAKVFIPKISNWSLCDSFCCELKIIKKNRERVWGFLKDYINSNKPYDIRVAVVMYLNYYIEEKYLEDLFFAFDRINNDDYYVKMAVAWAVSICFVKFPDETMKYLHNNRLDDFTYNKALQKICESLRVDKEVKNIIRKMKR